MRKSEDCIESGTSERHCTMESVTYTYVHVHTSLRCDGRLATSRSRAKVSLTNPCLTIL